MVFKRVLRDRLKEIEVKAISTNRWEFFYNTKTVDLPPLLSQLCIHITIQITDNKINPGKTNILQRKTIYNANSNHIIHSFFYRQ